MAAHLSLVTNDETAPAVPPRGSAFREVSGAAGYLLSRVVPAPRLLRHLLERAVLGLLPAPSIAAAPSLPVVVATPPERLQLVR